MHTEKVNGKMSDTSINSNPDETISSGLPVSPQPYDERWPLAVRLEALEAMCAAKLKGQPQSTAVARFNLPYDSIIYRWLEQVEESRLPYNPDKYPSLHQVVHLNRQKKAKAKAQAQTQTQLEAQRTKLDVKRAKLDVKRKARDVRLPRPTITARQDRAPQVSASAVEMERILSVFTKSASLQSAAERCLKIIDKALKLAD